MDFEEEDLSPDHVFGKTKLPDGPFYVSSILQDDDTAMDKFFDLVPFKIPEALSVERGVRHDDGVWLFMGNNPEYPDQGKGMKGKKRKKSTASTITGRPEHKDDVEHSGTWHMQLMGYKTWFIRPTQDAQAWGRQPPSLDTSPTASQSPTDHERRLCLLVDQGDVLFLNTRLWWHQTALGPQSDEGLSVSYARDFYLPGTLKSEGGEPKANVDGVHAPRACMRGECVLKEEEIPECDFPASEVHDPHHKPTTPPTYL